MPPGIPAMVGRRTKKRNVLLIIVGVVVILVIVLQLLSAQPAVETPLTAVKSTPAAPTAAPTLSAVETEQLRHEL